MKHKILSIEDGKAYIYSEKGKEEAKENQTFKIQNTRANSRTVAQNSAMHLYFTQLAEALNDAGYDVETVISKGKQDAIKKVFGWLKERIPAQSHPLLYKAYERIEIDRSAKVGWSMILVKEVLWKPIQAVQLGKESTTELLKVGDIDIIYRTVDKIVSERTGVSVAFPSIDGMLAGRRAKEIN